MTGFGKEAIGGGGFHDPSGIHDIDLIAALRHDGEIVGDKDDGGAKFFLPVFDEIENLLLHRHVKCGRRFVGNEDFRTGDEGHGDHDALAHSAGEFVGIGLNALFWFGNPNFSERVDRFVESFLLFDSFVNLERFRELLQR